MIGGKQSTPDSPPFYSVAEPTKTKRYDGLNGRSIELLSTGTQVLVPSSRHPNGERYVWKEYGAPASISRAVLERSMDELAAATLCAQAWPAKGSRQDAALAWSGFFCRQGWSLEKASNFLERVARATRDEEWQERVRAVESTYERIAGGGEATGWPKLAELIGQKAVDKVCSWLGVKRQAEHSSCSLNGSAGVQNGSDAFSVHETGR